MTCLLCNSSTREHLLGKKKTELYHFCDHCELIFKDPSVYLSKEEEQKRYEAHNNSPHDRGYTGIFHSFIETQILPAVKTPGTVLDFGSGPVPVFGEILKASGFDVTLYDPFFAPNGDSLTKKYALITMTEVLEHLCRPEETLEQVISLLEPEGFLGIMTHFHNFNLTDFDRWWYRHDSTHLTFYSLQTMAFIGRLFSLKIISSDSKKCIIYKRR